MEAVVTHFKTHFLSEHPYTNCRTKSPD